MGGARHVRTLPISLVPVPGIPDTRRRAPGHAAVQVAGCLTTREPHTRTHDQTTALSASACHAVLVQSQNPEQPNSCFCFKWKSLSVALCLGTRREASSQSWTKNGGKKGKHTVFVACLFSKYSSPIELFVHLALVAGMPRLSCAPCGRVPLATANPFCSSVLPLSQTYQGLSHTHSKVPTKQINHFLSHCCQF